VSKERGQTTDDVSHINKFIKKEGPEPRNVREEQVRGDQPEIAMGA